MTPLRSTAYTETAAIAALTRILSLWQNSPILRTAKGKCQAPPIHRKSEDDMNRRTFLISAGMLAASAILGGGKAHAEGKRILVAFFSATGTTRHVAEAIAAELKCDLYEIKPEKPYTSDDLDWHDKMSRSSIEMNDEKSRPKIAGALPDLKKYGAVFIGYPIWWGIAPRIVQTFVESCDMGGITAIPFCTSGGSPFDKSADLLWAGAPTAKWVAGRRINMPSPAEIVAWAKELKLYPAE